MVIMNRLAMPGKVGVRIPRWAIRNLAIMFFLVMTFRVLQYFPGMAIIKELWIVLFTMFALLPYLFWKARTGWRVRPYEAYVLLMLVVIPLYAGIARGRIGG